MLGGGGGQDTNLDVFNNISLVISSLGSRFIYNEIIEYYYKKIVAKSKFELYVKMDNGRYF